MANTIAAMLVRAIEQVQIEVVVFASSQRRKNQRHKWHDWMHFVRTTRGDFTGPGLSLTHPRYSSYKSSVQCTF